MKIGLPQFLRQPDNYVRFFLNETIIAIFIFIIISPFGH